MTHEHLPNACIEPGCQENPVSRRLRKVLRVATAANFAYGIFGVAAGIQTGSSALLADSFHTAVDTTAQGSHTSTHRAEEASLSDHHHDIDKKVRLKRTIGGALIGLGATVIFFEAGHELLNEDEAELNIPALIVAAGAVAVNGSIFVAVNKNNDGSMAWRDSVRHNKTDTITSALIMGGIGVSAIPALWWTDAAAGMAAAGMTGMVSYRIITDSHKHHH